MGGDLPKAIVRTREKPLLDHVLDALAVLAPEQTVLVAGHRRELLEAHLAHSPSAAQHSIQVVHQPEQLGTGHAVQCALPALSGFAGTVVITYADHPLFTPATLKLLTDLHHFKRATLTLLSFPASPPHGYGRIVRSADGAVSGIVEARDCNPEQQLLPECNSGVYAVDSAFLGPALRGLTNQNAQGEFYLTDIVATAAREGQRIAVCALNDGTEAAGVNSPAELAAVNLVLARRHLGLLQQAGVVFEAPDTCAVDATVQIAAGVTIGPNVQLCGNTTIAAGVTIEGTARIIDSHLEAGAVIKLGSRIEGSHVGAHASVGPFANIRPHSTLGPGSRIGNFVETKAATLAAGAKASHLTYLGDCTVGADSNIGAGTITVNYDGYKKSHTEIGAGVFIGSNSSLIAPVSIGDGALVAAGSVITRDVPADSLALGRARQEIKPDWAKRRRARISAASDGGGAAD
jgi:bifunctional UDP-N-acetylglucosamine pyrophosphorylase/glucosamine-1-phosphate N-acetyltransferase